MQRIIECFFTWLAVLIFSSAAWAIGPIRVAVYGDSLMSGYQLQPEETFPAKLDRKLREIGYTNVEVINMSVADETTAGGLERLSSLLVKQPDIVVLELGGNDAIRGINPDLIYKNLVHIIGRLLENRIYVVFVGIKAPPNLGRAYSEQIAAIYSRLAGFYNLAFYPFALEGVMGHPELNLADGYHPNGKGVEVMVEGIYRLVDAGLRWKWETLQYHQEFQRKWAEEVNASSVSAPVPQDASSAGGSMQQYDPAQPAPSPAP